AARIVAQVDNETLQLVTALRLELAYGLFQACGGLLVELCDADVANVTLHARADRKNVNHVAGDGNIKRLVHAFANDLQADLAVDWTAHLVDRLVQSKSLNRLVVDMADDVVGQDAGLGCRSFVDRRNNLDEPVLHGDLYS